MANVDVFKYATINEGEEKRHCRMQPVQAKEKSS